MNEGLKCLYLRWATAGSTKERRVVEENEDDADAVAAAVRFKFIPVRSTVSALPEVLAKTAILLFATEQH